MSDEAWCGGSQGSDTPGSIAEFATVARFGPMLIESLDPELRARIEAEITKSPLRERP